MDLRIFKNILYEASKKDNNTSKTIGYSPKILSDFLRTINSHYEQTKWWDYCYVGPNENSKHNQVFFDTIKYIVENEDIDITQDTRNILNKTDAATEKIIPKTESVTLRPKPLGEQERKLTISSIKAIRAARTTQTIDNAK